MCLRPEREKNRFYVCKMNMLTVDSHSIPSLNRSKNQAGHASQQNCNVGTLDITKSANSMELSPDWETASHKNLTFYGTRRFHKSPPLVPILSHMNPVHTTSSYLSKIHFSSHPLTSFLVVPLLLAKFACIPLRPMRPTCSVHLILQLVILILLGEEYMLWGSLLCSFLQHPITESLFDPNILLNTLFSNTLSRRFSLNVRDQVSHPYRITGKMVNYRIKGKVVPMLN
jgi:hypothetical protein